MINRDTSMIIIALAKKNIIHEQILLKQTSTARQTACSQMYVGSTFLPVFYALHIINSNLALVIDVYKTAVYCCVIAKGSLAYMFGTHGFVSKGSKLVQERSKKIGRTFHKTLLLSKLFFGFRKNCCTGQCGSLMQTLL